MRMPLTCRSSRSSRKRCSKQPVSGRSKPPVVLARAAATGLLYLTVSSALALEPVTTAADTPPAEPGFNTNLWTRSTLLGDAGGVRSFLWNDGITFGIVDYNEGWGNVTGGIKRGATYNGATLANIGLDTQRAFGWEGGTFNISAWNIRGRNIAVDNLLNLQTPSGILAADTTRLWEVWFQQSFYDGAFDIKLGQQSIDQEFMVSQGSGLFINTMMGWPMLPSADLYAGGPAYPLSSLGVRLRAQAGHGITGLLGVYQDNPPSGPFNDDSQLRGSTRWGGNFNLRTGALVIGELQYALNQPSSGDMDTGASNGGLPGTYKIGFWYDSASFPSQQFDNTGLSLADPASNGTPLMIRNNFSIYGVADQMVWRPSENSPRSLSVFARLMGGPGDRNLINFSVNAGVTLKAPFEGRDDDTVGVGFGIARVSNSARGFDNATALFSGVPFPARTIETFFEVTYQYTVAPWWQLQPDFQYVINPAGGIPNPNNPTKRIGNEALFGMRSIVTF
jgi:porin